MTDQRWRHDPFAPPPPVSLTGVIQPPPAAPEQVEPRSDDGLDDLKKAELVAMADDLGVDSSGNKADIVARLRAI